MQVRSISVRNVRSYEEGRLELPPGITLLVGDVGSGKTSLLHAIEMALFGFAEVPAEHLVRHREREAEVVLRLSEGEHRYEFRRRFRRRRVKGKESFDTEESSYAEDGRRTRYSPTELKQRAIDLLGFPDNPSPRAHSDVWRWAVYIPQERMREVLLQRPDDRLDTVRKALGIETYRTAAENAADLASALTASAERAEARAEGLRHFEESQERARMELGQLQARLLELGRAESEARVRLGEADAHGESLERSRLALEADRRRREELAARARADDQERAGLERRRAQASSAHRGAAEEAQRDGAEADRLRLPESVRAGLDSRLATLRDERERGERTAQQAAGLEAAESSARQTLRSTHERLGRAQEELRTAEASAAALPPGSAPTPPAAPSALPRESLARAIDELEPELARAARSATESELALEQLRQLIAGGECPQCHQPVRPAEFAAHEADAAAEVEQRRERLGALTQRRDRLREELRALEGFERELAAWRERDRERSRAIEQLARATQEVASLQGQVATLGQQLAEFQGERKRLSPALERRGRLADEFRAVESELAAAARQSEKEARLRASAELATQRAKFSQEQITSLDSQLEAVATRSRAGVAEAAELTRRLAGLPDLDEELRAHRDQLSTLRAGLEAALAQLARARQGDESARRQIEESAERLREREEWRAMARSERSRAQWVKGEFRQGLIELERRRLARAHAEFGRLLSQNFSRLIEDPALLARCDAAFTPEVELEGESTPAEALSGGERTALALAYRLAMGAMVRGSGRLKLDTLILDEPTDGFSPEQVLRLGELLASLGAPQLLLVSHERQLEAIADHVVIVRKVDGRSRLESEESSAGATEPASVPPEPDRPPRAADPETPPPPTAPAPLP